VDEIRTNYRNQRSERDQGLAGFEDLAVDGGLENGSSGRELS
jgi:hypothetical protein